MSMQTVETGQKESRAMVKGPAQRYENLKEIILAKKGDFAAIMPRHMMVDRLLRVALTAASRTPDLLVCSPASFVLSLATSAFLGLEVNTPLQRAYLIPRDNKHTKTKEATFMPGYRGLIWLALQSGHVENIETDVVYEKEIEQEKFKVRRGTDSRIEHEPIIIGDRGQAVAYYAVATLKNGFKPFVVMTREEVIKIMNRSAASADGPWKTDFDEMAKKTTIRRIAKSLPLSEERFHIALRHDARVSEAEPGDGGNFTDVLDALPEGAAKALTAGIDGGDEAAPSQAAPADRGEALAAQLAGNGKKG